MLCLVAGGYIASMFLDGRSPSPQYSARSRCFGWTRLSFCMTGRLTMLNASRSKKSWSALSNMPANVFGKRLVLRPTSWAQARRPPLSDNF